MNTLYRAALALVLTASLHAATLGRLGDLEITVEDVQASLASLSPGQLDTVRADPKLLEQVVRSYLVQRLVLKQATEARWHEQPKVTAKIERVRASVITESFLENVAQPEASYPAEQEVRQAYEAQRESFRVPRSFRLAQIFVAEKSTAKLEKVTQSLKGRDARFEDIAGEFSDDAVSASRGGELGWLTETHIEKDLLTTVASLKLNEVSKPVQLKDGWHFLKLLDARAPYVPTLEQVRVQLVHQLRTEKLRANTQAYLSNLLKEHPLSFDAEALAKALPPVTPLPSGP